MCRRRVRVCRVSCQRSLAVPTALAAAAALASLCRTAASAQHTTVTLNTRVTPDAQESVSVLVSAIVPLATSDL